MRIPVFEQISGTTVRATWVNSGVTVDPGGLVSRLLDSTENEIDSRLGVSSGNGFYYSLHTLPLTPAWFVNEWIAIIQANTYVSRQFIRGVHPEVD